MRRLGRLLIVVLVGSLAGATAFGADWQPPKDGVVTEKQFGNYIKVLQEVIDNARAAGKAIDNSQSGAAALALALRTNEKFKASLASHGMTEAEYDWLGSMVWQAYGQLLRDDIVQKAQGEMDQQKKTMQGKLADHKAKLAAHEKALKEGRRVMSKEERESAVASAKEEQKSALEEAKQHAEEASAAQKEADKSEADAKAADAAAKNPPSDVIADDRPGFIEQKKSEAQSARDAAKEARDKVAEARKAESESKAKAATAGKKVADPDLAMTDEEKAEFKKQNEEQIASIRGEIKDTEQGMQLLSESGAALAQNFQQSGGEAVPPQNVALMKKHREEFEKAWGMKKDGK